MIQEEGKHYLYRHIRLDTNEVFYVGIGTKNKHGKYLRAYRKQNRNSHWINIANKTKWLVEILLESDDYDFIKQKEIEFIALYGRKDLKKGVLVNMTDGGEGVTNRVITEEFRLKCKGRKMSKESIEKMRLSQILRDSSTRNISGLVTQKYSSFPQWLKDKISLGNKGKKMSEENKQLLSSFKQGHNNPMFGRLEQLHHNAKVVYQYDLNNNLIQTYPCLKTASKITNYPYNNLSRCCLGKQNSCKGFKWSYVPL